MGLSNLLGQINLLSIVNLLANIGIIGYAAKLIRKGFPSNYEHLHISASQGGAVFIPPNITCQQSFSIQLSNAGQANIYIARAYFQSKQRVWWTLWLWNRDTNLRVHPRSDRIADKDNAFELKFPNSQPSLFTDYETLIRPGHNNRQTTWLALEEPIEQRFIDGRKCGVFYIEYATSNKQGIHRIGI